MKALILGIVILAAAVFAVLPETAGFGLHWAKDVLTFLRGCAPVLAAFIALVLVFIGIADIKDRAEAKKDAKEAQ